MTDLILIGLATWYVAYAVTSTHGPGGIFEWVRENVWHGRRGKLIVTQNLYRKGIENPPEPVQVELPEVAKNGLLDCPVCLAFWAALILLLVPMGVVVQALALAGAAMLMHGLSGWRFGGG